MPIRTFPGARRPPPPLAKGPWVAKAADSGAGLETPSGAAPPPADGPCAQRLQAAGLPLPDPAP